jgi:carboxypeptidase Taq
MKKEVPIEKYVKEGHLLPIKGWLQENIHRHGSLYLPEDLLIKVTGEKLNPKYFIDYLTKKYSSLYDLS